MAPRGQVLHTGVSGSTPQVSEEQLIGKMLHAIDGHTVDGVRNVHVVKDVTKQQLACHRSQFQQQQQQQQQEREREQEQQEQEQEQEQRQRQRQTKQQNKQTIHNKQYNKQPTTRRTRTSKTAKRTKAQT